MSWQAHGEIRRRGNVTLDANGNGTVNFDVRHANERWIITDVILSTNQAQTTAPYPVATVYSGGQSVGVSEGATWIANQDTMSGRWVMDCGIDLQVAFTGGPVGVVATAIIEGTSELWR